MQARLNLSRLARKLLIRAQKTAETPQKRKYRVISLKNKNDRQDIAHKRLRNLTMKLIVFDAKNRSREACFNLSRLSRLLL